MKTIITSFLLVLMLGITSAFAKPKIITNGIMRQGVIEYQYKLQPSSTITTHPYDARSSHYILHWIITGTQMVGTTISVEESADGVNFEPTILVTTIDAVGNGSASLTHLLLPSPYIRFIITTTSSVSSDVVFTLYLTMYPWAP